MSYGLSYCGYDVRAAKDMPVIFDGSTVLVPVLEKFTMPSNVVGFVKDKSTWARRGLLVNQAVIEPGWSGYLTLRFTMPTTGWEHNEVTIIKGDPIAQVVFQFIDEVPETIYNGKYQNQAKGITEAILEPDVDEV